MCSIPDIEEIISRREKTKFKPNDVSLVGDLIFGTFGIALCLWLATRPEPPMESKA